MLSSDTYLITSITNLHAGSGDADYGNVDKQVQRDSVTGLPCINASGIKGAFREAFTSHQSADVVFIFGSENRKGSSSNLEQGNYNFYTARLLCLPVRSNHNLFYLATCPELIQDFLAEIQRFGATQASTYKDGLTALANMNVPIGNPVYFGNNIDNIKLEDKTAINSALPDGTNTTILSKLFGQRIAMFNCNDFQELANELPVIARNHLENGISANLWYEEVVPRESRFYYSVTKPVDDMKLETGLTQNLKNHLQIGGNATVGNGLCKIEKL